MATGSNFSAFLSIKGPVTQGGLRFANTLSCMALMQKSSKCHAPLNWLCLKERRRVEEKESERMNEEGIN